MAKNKELASKGQAPLPARPLSLFDELDRFFQGGFPMRGWPSHWPGWSELTRGGMPPVDVIDRDKEILVRAELPGVKKDEIDVTVTDDRITIKGEYRKENKEEKGEYHRMETRYGSFSRSLDLPADVDAAKTSAKFEDGVLEITLPKVVAAKKKTIKVS